MRKYTLTSLVMLAITISCMCMGCQISPNKDVDSSNEANSQNPIENTQDDSFSDTINNGANESDKGTNEGGIIVDEGDTPDEGEVVYQEPYETVSNVRSWTKWFVENGEVKEMEFSEYSGEIIPQEKYSRFNVKWTHVNGELYLGREEAWYHFQKITDCEDKVLLESMNISYGLEDGEAPHFRVFDINTKEIISIYPDDIEEDYYIRDVWVSSDLSKVILLDWSTVLYYDGMQVSIIEQFKDKLEGVSQPVITMEEGKILVLGYGSQFEEICCYVYDIALDKLTEYRYLSSRSTEDGLYTYELEGEDFRYGRCYKDGYFTIVDLLTGREDKTEIPKEKVRHVENVSEDWFFVLADYGYFIEKSTGRIIAKTEYEVKLDKEEVRYTAMLVPSDEDIYFCLRAADSEAGIIYKIELEE